MNNPIIDENGNHIWYDDQNQRHRDDDLPAKIWVDGAKSYRFHGYFHRTFGPAFEWRCGEICWQWLDRIIEDQ